MLLGGDAAAVGELLGADFEDKHLVERVDLERARTELELASVGGATPLTGLRPRLRKSLALFACPLRPAPRVDPRQLDVEREHPARLERCVEAP